MATALRQANNSIGQAVQLLQEQPDLIQVLELVKEHHCGHFPWFQSMFERIPFLQLAAEERSSEGGDDDDDMQVRRWLVNILILNIG